MIIVYMFFYYHLTMTTLEISKFYVGTYTKKGGNGGKFIILKRTKCYITIQYSEYDERKYSLKIRNYDWGNNEEYVEIPKSRLPRTIKEQKINARDLLPSTD